MTSDIHPTSPASNPRRTPPTSSLDGHLTDRDVRILHDLDAYRLLTTRQIQRLHLPVRPYGDHASVGGATRGTTRVLGRLGERRAIQRLRRRIGGVKHGSALTIWQLGPAGERYLRALDGLPPRRYLEPGAAFTDHTLAVADIAVMLTERSRTEQYDLLELASEPSCWRRYSIASGTTVTLKPDLLVVTADQTTETHSFVEVDRGTEHLPQVLRKCHRYQDYATTGTEQANRGLFPAVVWVTPDLTRAEAIRSAIRADPSLSPSLFWVVAVDQALSQLAPYGLPGAALSDPGPTPTHHH